MMFYTAWPSVDKLGLRVRIEIGKVLIVSPSHSSRCFIVSNVDRI